MSKVNFYVASIVRDDKGGKSGLVTPDERQEARRLMTGVAIYAQTGSRTADPTFLVPEVGATGNVPIATPLAREYFELMVGPKTEHKDGQQYIEPYDLAIAVHSMSKDDKYGGKDRLPVFDRTTGRVSFDLHAGSDVATGLRQVTRTYYGLDTPKPLPTGTEAEIAKAMPAWQAADAQRQAERDKHIAKFHRYALCSSDMAGMQDLDIAIIAMMVDDLKPKPGAAPGVSNTTDPWQNHGTGNGKVSAFGGTDPSAQATRATFANVTNPNGQMVGHDPDCFVELAARATAFTPQPPQTPRGDQMIGAPWHRNGDAHRRRAAAQGNDLRHRDQLIGPDHC